MIRTVRTCISTSVICPRIEHIEGPLLAGQRPLVGGRRLVGWRLFSGVRLSTQDARTRLSAVGNAGHQCLSIGYGIREQAQTGGLHQWHKLPEGNQTITSGDRRYRHSCCMQQAGSGKIVAPESLISLIPIDLDGSPPHQLQGCEPRDLQWRQDDGKYLSGTRPPAAPTFESPQLQLIDPAPVIAESAMNCPWIALFALVVLKAAQMMP